MDIRKIIEESILVKTILLQDEAILESIKKVSLLITETFLRQGRVLLCGNGGSAADAQHIAAELSGRFAFDRAPLDAEALHVNTSYLTAVANDYSFDEVYARLVNAKGRKGDVLIAISTSGNSPNILKAIKAAELKGLTTVALTGHKGGAMKDLCNHCICVPSEATPRIQETHILIGHIICGLVEQHIFGQEKI